MQDFIPSGSVLATFSIACFVLFITPGPDMSLFLAKTLAGGRRHGLAAMIGANVGCLVHTCLAAIGVSALLAASTVGFTILKLVGAVYLGWLAIDAIRNGSALSVKASERIDSSVWRTFAMGVGTNLTNPKVVLFFVTFLPQFVEANDPHAGGKLVFLGLYVVLFCVPLSALMILGAERLVETLKARPKVMRAIDWSFAGIFGAFAVKILTAQAR